MLPIHVQKAWSRGLGGQAWSWSLGELAPPSRQLMAGGLRDWCGKAKPALVYSTQASQQLGKHTSLAVEQVIRCVKYAGVQTEFPQRTESSP